MDAARAEAARLAQEAKQASAKETEAKVNAGRRQDQSSRSRPPSAKIRDAVDAARAEIEAVAAEATQRDGRAADRHRGRHEGSRSTR